MSNLPKPAQDDDQTLLAQIASGNRQAFTFLMQRHTAGILTFARGLIRNQAIAEELTQDAFLRIWQKATSWVDQGFSVKSWIYKIVHNLCIDHIRKQGREVLLDIDANPEMEPKYSIEPVHQIEYEHLIQTMSTLPERQVSALYLCCYQGLSNLEAANILEISVEALESLLARARRQLRALWIHPQVEG